MTKKNPEQNLYSRTIKDALLEKLGPEGLKKLRENLRAMYHGKKS